MDGNLVMSMNARAEIGYGFHLTDKVLLDKIFEDEESYLGEDLRIMFHGTDSNMECVISFKESIHSVSESDYLKPAKYNPPCGYQKGYLILTEWCNRYSVKNYTIDYYMCVSYG